MKKITLAIALMAPCISSADIVDYYHDTYILDGDTMLASLAETNGGNLDFLLLGGSGTLEYDKESGTLSISNIQYTGPHMGVLITSDTGESKTINFEIYQRAVAENWGEFDRVTGECWFTDSEGSTPGNLGRINYAWEHEIVDNLYATLGPSVHTGAVSTARKIVSLSGNTEFTKGLADVLFQSGNNTIWWANDQLNEISNKPAFDFGTISAPLMGEQTFTLGGWYGYFWHSDSATMLFESRDEHRNESYVWQGTWTYEKVEGKNTSGRFYCSNILHSTLIDELRIEYLAKLENAYIPADIKANIRNRMEISTDLLNMNIAKEWMERAEAEYFTDRITALKQDLYNNAKITHEDYANLNALLQTATTHPDIDAIEVEFQAAKDRYTGGIDERVRQEVVRIQTILKHTEMSISDQTALQARLDAVTVWYEFKGFRNDIRLAHEQFLESKGLSQAELISKMKTVLRKMLEYADLQTEDRAEIEALLRGETTRKDLEVIGKLIEVGVERKATLDAAHDKVDDSTTESEPPASPELVIEPATESESGVKLKSTGGGSLAWLGLFGIAILRKLR
jgi:hypothetical protein